MKVLSFVPANIVMVLTISRRFVDLSGSPLVLVWIYIRHLFCDGTRYFIWCQIGDALVGPYSRPYHHHCIPPRHRNAHGHCRIQSQYRKPRSSMYLITFRVLVLLTIAPWQMIGGVMIPGKPVANMYFTLYGYQTYTLTLNLLRDLKLVGLSFVFINGWFFQHFIGSIHETSTSCYIRCTDNWRCHCKPPIYSCYKFIWVPCM